MDRVQKHSTTQKTLLPKVSSEVTPSASGIAFPRRLSQKGMLTIIETVIGMVIISILVVAGLMVFRVTEKGTIAQKKKEQALNLAKQKAEEVKAYLTTLNWDNMKVDVRFPPAQTPAATPYNSYPGVTITLGQNKFILNTEVRYIYDKSATELAYIPTPATAATPEIGNIVRIRADAYYGDFNNFVPLATAEPQSIILPRMVYSNILSNRAINIGGIGEITGYVYGGPSGCAVGTGVSGVEVGLYQGDLKVLSAYTDINGYYTFTDVPEGIYNIQTVSSPGYVPVTTGGGACNFTNPVTLVAGSNISDRELGVVPIPVWNYYGMAVTTNPVINVYPPGTITPTPVALPTVVPVPNAIVYADDGNSLPVTANASGAFTIIQVRATPVAGHAYDTIGADSPTTYLTGQNYNIGLSMYPNFVSGGVTYIGPITVYVNSTTGNTQAVTFKVLDETYNALPSAAYPVTIIVSDGSQSPPTTILSSGVTQGALTLRQGAPNVANYLKNNTSPVSWITFNQQMNISASVTDPVTMLNYAVGTAAGTILGMGVFNYAQFHVRAKDHQGQYFYDIPVSYTSPATFGTFRYAYLRTPVTVSGELDYDFDVSTGGDFTSTFETKRIVFGAATTLDNPIYVSPLNVYLAVTVTQNGVPYPYGSWVSAQPCTTACAPPTTGMGYGYNISNFYSAVTRADGTVLFPVQLTNAGSTTYAVSAQIIDPATFNLTTTTVANIAVTVGNSYFYPRGVSIGF